MRRLIPLAKMTLRIVVVGIVLTAVQRLLLPSLLGLSRAQPLAEFLTDVISSGAMSGLLLALPMALATLVFFREIRRPLFYRSAMVTVALIATLLVEYSASASFYRSALFAPGQDSWRLIWFAVSLIFNALLVYACGLSARAYVREFNGRKIVLHERGNSRRALKI